MKEQNPVAVSAREGGRGTPPVARPAPSSGEPKPPCAICKLNSPVALDRVLIVADFGNGTSTTGSAGARDAPEACHKLGRRGLGRLARGRFTPRLGAPPGSFFSTHAQNYRCEFYMP
jgi:hypothetical protein